eukprot:scaffold118890_cov54-Prasinocladus_malaysianus.AAC.1
MASMAPTCPEPPDVDQEGVLRVPVCHPGAHLLGPELGVEHLRVHPALPDVDVVLAFVLAQLLLQTAHIMCASD